MPQIKFLNVNVVISLLEPALEMATVLFQHPKYVKEILVILILGLVIIFSRLHG